MASVVSIWVDTMLPLGRFLCLLSLGGLGFSFAPLKKWNTPEYCIPSLFEYTRTLAFAITSLGCGFLSVSAATRVKMHLAVLFREEVDTDMRVQTAATLVTRWVLSFAQVALVAGYTSAGLMMFYLAQWLSSVKFSCMGTATQTALAGFMSVVAITPLPIVYKVFTVSRVFFHARLNQATSERDEESNCCKIAIGRQTRKLGG